MSNVKEHLKEMVDTLGKVKGVPYANLCLSFYNVGNHIEAIINVAQFPKYLMESMVEQTSNATTLLAMSILYYEVRRRHPAYDSYDDVRKTKLGHDLTEEFGRDLTMLQNKEQEFRV